MRFISCRRPRRRTASTSSASPGGALPSLCLMTGHCPRWPRMTTCSGRPHEHDHCEERSIHPARRDRAGRGRGDRLRQRGCCGCPPSATEMAAAAQREQLSYLGFLAELVMAECDDRDRRRAARRINDAGFPRGKRIEEFDFEANSSVSPAVIHQSGDLRLGQGRAPVVLIGDSGTGKWHPLDRPGTAAAEAEATGSATPSRRSW